MCLCLPVNLCLHIYHCIWKEDSTVYTVSGAGYDTTSGAVSFARFKYWPLWFIEKPFHSLSCSRRGASQRRVRTDFSQLL